MVADAAVASYLYGIADDAVVADFGVVADMGLRHDEGMASDACGRAGMNAAVDDDVFADAVVIADYHFGLVAFPAEVLRIGGNYRTFVDDIAGAYSGARKDACVRTDVAAVAYYGVFIDEGECVDTDIIANFCGRINEGQWADLCHGGEGLN